MPAAITEAHSLPARARTQWWRIVLYTVYGDESHDETSARVFAVAGLFGSEDHWNALDEKWRERTGGKIFHASDCETDQGDFAGIDHAENLRLYKDLVQILCESQILGFGAAIDAAGHRGFFPDVLDDIPYYRCFRDVVIQCGKWARMAIPQGMVEFIFDQRIESNYNADVLYGYIANQPEYRNYFSEKISFASRKLIGIQAADLYAREVMKHLDNELSPVKRTRRSWAALRAAKRFGADFFMREHFGDFKRQFDDVAKSVGMNLEHYKEWLRERKLTDSVSSRHRYIIETDDSQGNRR